MCSLVVVQQIVTSVQYPNLGDFLKILNFFLNIQTEDYRYFYQHYFVNLVIITPEKVYYTFSSKVNLLLLPKTNISRHIEYLD